MQELSTIQIMSDRSPPDVWQYLRHMLDGCGYSDHKPEVTCRINGFGYILWECELLDKGNYHVYRSGAWPSWKDIMAGVAKWLNENPRNGILPLEMFPPLLPVEMYNGNLGHID